MAIVKKPRCVIDGIACYTEVISENYDDYHSAGLDNLYAAEKDHFWFVARRERILSACAKHVSPKCNFLEIGAGTGYVAQGLKNKGYQVSVGEIHMPGLIYAKEKGIVDCYQFDLFDPPFLEEFEAIGMFDVLEHLEDDINAIHQVSKMLRPNGKLFITVPAHQWLWCREDSIAAHKRRYSKEKLIQVIEAEGLRVVEAQFFFIGILPLLYLRHLLNKDFTGKVTEIEINTGVHINPILNKLLLSITRFENLCSKYLPNIAGGSLLVVAEKN